MQRPNSILNPTEPRQISLVEVISGHPILSSSGRRRRLSGTPVRADARAGGVPILATGRGRVWALRCNGRLTEDGEGDLHEVRELGTEEGERLGLRGGDGGVDASFVLGEDGFQVGLVEVDGALCGRESAVTYDSAEQVRLRTWNCGSEQ